MTEINNLIIELLEKVFKNQVFEIKSGLAKGLKRRFGKGFKPKFFLSKEEKFLLCMDLNNKVVFDVGSYIGIYSLFFARAVGPKGKVFSFEPNPENYAELVFNLGLNLFKNVNTLNLGAGEKKSEMTLFVPPYTSRGSFDRKTQLQLASKEICRCFQVEVNSIDNLIKRKVVIKPDFVKLDVEGFESEAIKGMAETIKKYKPELFIEIHKPVEKEILDLLLDNYYSLYHVESEKFLGKNSFVEKGHIYCK